MPKSRYGEFAVDLLRAASTDLADHRKMSLARSIGALQQNVWLSGPSCLRLGGNRYSTTNANWSEEPNMGVSLSVYESCSLWAIRPR